MFEEQQSKKREKPIPIVIPPDILAIANPAISKDDLNNFLKCICGGYRRLTGMNRGVLEFTCNHGCVSTYPDSHPYFNIAQLRAEVEAKKQSLNKCSKCDLEISESQANTSREFTGKPFCEKCMGAELV